MKSGGGQVLNYRCLQNIVTFHFCSAAVRAAKTLVADRRYSGSRHYILQSSIEVVFRKDADRRGGGSRYSLPEERWCLARKIVAANEPVGCMLWLPGNQKGIPVEITKAAEFEKRKL